MKVDTVDEGICPCVKKVIVNSEGKATVIPDFSQLSSPTYSVTPLDGCFCPRTAGELRMCLKGCLTGVLNEKATNRIKIKSVFIMDESGNETELK